MAKKAFVLPVMTCHFVFLPCFLEVTVPLTLGSLLCAGLRCVYFPTTGDEWLNQKWRPDGTETIFGVIAIVCFLKLVFIPAHNLSCLFGF